MLYHYFCSKCMKLHSLVPTIHTFTAKTWHAASMEFNQYHSLSLHISIVRKNFGKVSFSQELLFSGTDSCTYASLKTTLLISSIHGSVVPFPPESILPAFYSYIHSIHLKRMCRWCNDLWLGMRNQLTVQLFPILLTI